MTRGRGNRTNNHNVRCICNAYVSEPVDECTHGHGPHRRIYLDEVCELIGWGVSIDEVARRLEVKVPSIERVALRRGTEDEQAIIRRALANRGRHRRAA